MDIEITHAPDDSRYEVWDGDALIGFTEYRLRGSHLSMNHTEINDGYEGKGVASRLIRFALADARERGLAVIPYCPFVRDHIARHADEQLDLVPAARRTEFALPEAA